MCFVKLVRKGGKTLLSYQITAAAALKGPGCQRAEIRNADEEKSALRPETIYSFIIIIIIIDGAGEESCV